ncbi:hypothetical protein OIB37_18365 [Streptomyces sp. NBC_00820]|uniref:hypothetical protein n=1 Tax=Streptomyces sp. NBC_00820 TaxID=2975842 RepID=UPI002ED10A41|nr:hypothetical protein OIB37_18365 [Streptomyces sp. NBC_00820]
MTRTRRLAMFTPLFVSALALGPTVAAHGAQQGPAAAPAKPRCVLTQDTANSKPDDPKFTLSASGFESGTVSFSGGNGGGATKTANGSFSVSNLGPGRYTASSDEDGTVNCGRTPGQKNEKKDARAQYRKGFSDGFSAIRANCGAKPPKNANKADPNYERGFKDGAKLAANRFCD